MRVEFMLVPHSSWFAASFSSSAFAVQTRCGAVQFVRHAEVLGMASMVQVLRIHEDLRERKKRSNKAKPGIRSRNSQRRSNVLVAGGL